MSSEGWELVEHEVGSDIAWHERQTQQAQQAPHAVRCLACAHHCTIQPGATGICAIRKNEDGVLRLLTYGHAMCANGRDPVEKKPLYHVMSGSFTYSMATVGCNFACDFCQNWDLSQCTKDIKKRCLEEKKPELIDIEVSSMGYVLSPQQLVDKAIQSGNHIMAFTYSEPTVFLEYALDTAVIAKQRGLHCVFKSNGFESEFAVDKMVGLIEAANIDLKSFRDEFYRKICHSRLQPVLDTIKRMHDRGIWVEVTTLVIPGENDSVEELTAIANFIAGIDPNIPWHVTPFHPDYKMTDKPRTSSSLLNRGYECGKKAGLKFVYARAGEGQNTYCPECNELLVVRVGMSAAIQPSFNVHTGTCKCGFKLPGVWH
eukprot:TRINITY_DN28213_c0_g1_i1.p1 TRINITY_DN28213_c0_g1~~TRINITY_DN28213_c0_g1_i1.p1  ORF type:complete len:380 (+),score=46.57 TRINITY_DN28213_c0_g1_i1:27-1142(+)